MSGGAGNVPAGWYPDPAGGGMERYWTGMAWAEQTRPSTTPVGSFGATASPGTPRNGMSVAALVLGIIGLVTFIPVLSILAIVFGAVGLGRANRGEATNKGMATAGLVLGIVGILIQLLVLLLIAAGS